MEPVQLILVLGVWVMIGVVTALVMRRRGHDLAVWIALGAVLGPLIIPLAIERARFHKAAVAQREPLPASPTGVFDVVAGIDGSDESIAAIESALELFGESVTSLTLATVLDYDAQSPAAGLEPREKAQAMLDEAASRADVGFVRTQILFGRADRELAEYAGTHGAELIVVGARGHGASEALFGSVTSRMVGACDVPIFVGPSSLDRSRSAGADAAIGVEA